MDKKFEEILTFLWILGTVLGGLVAVTIGFAVWDRRTALTPAIRRSQQLEEREERIESALQELARIETKPEEGQKNFQQH